MDGLIVDGFVRSIEGVFWKWSQKSDTGDRQPPLLIGQERPHRIAVGIVATVTLPLQHKRERRLKPGTVPGMGAGTRDHRSFRKRPRQPGCGITPSRQGDKIHRAVVRSQQAFVGGAHSHFVIPFPEVGPQFTASSLLHDCLVRYRPGGGIYCPPDGWEAPPPFG